MKKPNITEKAVKLATSQLTNDIRSLSNRRDNALSAFRQTATELGNINDTLRIKVGDLTDLALFIEEQKSAANKMIEDNTAVQQNIYKIIGE